MITSTTSPPGSGVRIGLARPADLRHVAGIELAAGELLREHFGAAAAAPLSLSPPSGGERDLDGTLLVAVLTGATPGDEAGEVVGFAHVTSYDDIAHLEELAVLPACGKRGIGTALVRAAMEEARWAGSSRLSLCTFGDVPWNAPFYRSLGFAEVDRLEPFQARLRAAERGRGLDDMGPRVVMDVALTRGPRR